MIVITGAASTGKSSLVNELKEKLSGDKFDIHDIDEADRWGDDYEAWRDAKVEYWLKQSIENRKLGIETILCGIIYPKHVVKSPAYAYAAPVEYINLDATPDVITQRYLKRRQVWLDRQIEISKELREELQVAENAQIIDTSNIPSSEVAERVVNLIQPTDAAQA